MISANYLDSETRSTVDLPRSGVYRYTASPYTDVLCLSYAFGDGPVKVWRRNDPLPTDLLDAVTRGERFYIHNAEFDVEVWNEILANRKGWPRLQYGQVRCTAAMAAAMGLPRSLDGAARGARLGVTKDMEGNKLMRLMCKPRGYDDNLEPLWHETQEQLDRLYSYAGQDIHTMRALRRQTFDLREDEQRLFELTAKINGRGIRVDLPAVRRSIPMVQEASAELRRKVREVTQGEVESATQRDKLLAFMADYLVVLPNARRKTLELFQATAGETVHERVRSLIDLRLEAAKTSTGKLNAMVMRTSPDGRLRGSLVYYGAVTGRYSSVGVQLQNLPRPTMSFAECCEAIRTIVEGCGREALEWLFGPTLQVVSDCLRSYFIPARGHDLAVADFSKIEAVVNAWCAGQDDLLQAFADGRDTYCEMASIVFGRTITKADQAERQIGKILILACGYGMGGDRFWETCILAGLPISLLVAHEAIATYRQTNSSIQQHWWDQERAAMDAVRSPGAKITCGVVTWTMRANVLWCRLPSGRVLAYPYPRIRDYIDKNGTMRPRLCHWGHHPLTHQWTEISTYGAKLVENIVQAIARDLLAWAMLMLDQEGIKILLTVHDELVAEAERADKALDIILDVMRTAPAWASGLPVNAVGEVLPRYGKLD